MKLPEIEEAQATVRYIVGEDKIETRHGISHGVLSFSEHQTMLMFIIEDEKIILIPYEHIISVVLENIYVDDEEKNEDVNYG